MAKAGKVIKGPLVCEILPDVPTSELLVGIEGSQYSWQYCPFRAFRKPSKILKRFQKPDYSPEEGLTFNTVLPFNENAVVTVGNAAWGRALHPIDIQQYYPTSFTNGDYTTAPAVLRNAVGFPNVTTRMNGVICLPTSTSFDLDTFDILDHYITTIFAPRHIVPMNIIEPHTLLPTTSWSFDSGTGAPGDISFADYAGMELTDIYIAVPILGGIFGGAQITHDASAPSVVMNLVQHVYKKPGIRYRTCVIDTDVDSFPEVYDIFDKVVILPVGGDTRPPISDLLNDAVAFFNGAYD